MTNWLHDAEPAPAILVLPDVAASLDEADAACELWEHYSGKTLDPTQRLTVQVMLAQDDAGRLAGIEIIRKGNTCDVLTENISEEDGAQVIGR